MRIGNSLILTTLFISIPLLAIAAGHGGHFAGYGGFNNFHNGNNFNFATHSPQAINAHLDRQQLNSENIGLQNTVRALHNNELHGSPSAVKADLAQIAALKNELHVAQANLYQVENNHNHNYQGWGEAYNSGHHYSGWGG